MLEPAAYNELYSKGQPVSNGKLIFRPLNCSLLDNHFWSAYQSISAGQPGVLLACAKSKRTHQRISAAQPCDFWQLQMPLVCRNALPDVTLAAQAQGRRLKLNAEIYLSAIGWSTHLEIRIETRARLADPVDTLNQLMNRADTPPPFTIDGRGVRLTDVFRRAEERLRAEVYAPDAEPHRKMQIPRQWVISPNKLHEDRRQPLEWEELPDGDKIEAFCLLYGKKLEIDKVSKYEKDVLFTKISGPNFALTDFNKGTFVCLQREALDPARPAAPHCIAANIRNLTMMAYRNWRFFDEAQGSPAGSPAEALAERAKGIIKQLPKAYRNQFCQQLLAHHKELQRIAALP